MTATADRFTAEEVDRLEIDGQPVHSLITVELEQQTTITVVRHSTNPERTQGVMLDSTGRLLIGGVGAGRFVLWADTAPGQVEIEAQAGRISIWNVWRDDIEQAWVGWSGIRPTFDEDELILRCSDGHEPGDAADIVVGLCFDPPPR